MKNIGKTIFLSLVGVWVFVSLLLLTTSCSGYKKTTDITSNFSLPKELEGYKIYALRSDGGGMYLYLVLPKDMTKPAMVFEHHNKGPISTCIIAGKKYNIVESEE